MHDSILHPTDYKGDLCGVGRESSNSYAAFALGAPCCHDFSKIPPVPVDQYSPQYAVRVCVSDCAQTQINQAGNPNRKIIRPYVSTSRNSCFLSVCAFLSVLRFFLTVLRFAQCLATASRHT